MHSYAVDGKVLDFTYKKLQPNHYAFSLGGVHQLGQIFNMGICGWSAVSNYKGLKVDGFMSRTAAALFLLDRFIESRKFHDENPYPM